MEGVQHYVATLTAHDLHASTDVFAYAAFDLDAQNPTDVTQGLVDWDAFLSPTQHHVPAACHQHLLTWGHLESTTCIHLGHGTIANFPQTTPEGVNSNKVNSKQLRLPFGSKG